MQLYQLEQFSVLARCEHMTLAAEMLHISQPALSQSISRLEKELGVPLFDRQGRKIYLNNFGHEFLKRVEAVFCELDDGRKILDDMKEAGANRIRVTDLSCPFLAGNLFRLYLAQHSGTALEYRILDAQTAKHTLRNGESDFLLSTVHPEDVDFNCEPLGQLCLELLIPEEHPLANQSTISLDECRHLHFVGPDRFSELRQFFEHLCYTKGFCPRFSYESNDRSLMAEFAHRCSGAMYVFNGLTSAFSNADTSQLKQLGLRRVLLQEEYELPTLWLVMQKDRYLSTAAQEFILFIKTLF
jgi:DNA-binding transcriptional LysR family regulator